jgi:hypothetical protein
MKRKTLLCAWCNSPIEKGQKFVIERAGNKRFFLHSRNGVDCHLMWKLYKKGVRNEP